MDPNAALAAARDARASIEADGQDAVDLLVESTRALDEWLSAGGSLPEDWTRAQGAPVSVRERAPHGQWDAPGKAAHQWGPWGPEGRPES
jgi:hypothetical protein